jgi:hypothetical protein
MVDHSASMLGVGRRAKRSLKAWIQGLSRVQGPGKLEALLLKRRNH